MCEAHGPLKWCQQDAECQQPVQHVQAEDWLLAQILALRAQAAADAAAAAAIPKAAGEQ